MMRRSPISLPCALCRGSGKSMGGKCTACTGKGGVLVHPREDGTGLPCGNCGGSGKSWGYICRSCMGTGWQDRVII